MGNELVTDSFPLTRGGNPTPISYSEMFREQCPMYLAMGMTYDEYWHGECDRTIYYRKAFRLKRKMRNQELWLQGMYIYEAIGEMSPILRTSFDKTPKKPIPYAAEPYPMDQQEIEERRVEKEKKEMELMKAKVAAWALATKKRFEEKGGGDSG